MRLLAVPLVETVEEKIDAIGRDGLALVAVEVIDSFELADRVDQTGDDDIAKEGFGDGVESDLVEEPAKNEFRADGTDRCVAKGLKDFRDFSGTLGGWDFRVSPWDFRGTLGDFRVSP